MDKKFFKLLEEAEIRYWSDYYLYSSASAKEKLGIFSNIIAGAFCGSLSNIDTLVFNRVIGLGLDNNIDIELVNDIIQFYRETGIPRFFIQLSPAALQENLSDMLIEKGFTHHNNWAKLYKNLDKRPAVENRSISVEELALMDSGIYEDIIKRAFEWEEGSSMLFSQTIGKPGWKHYSASLEGKLIAAAALYINGNFASMAIAGTLPEFRGLGAQGELITRRINDAINSGCTTALVETAEDTREKPSPSFRNMKNNGFELAYLRPNYIYTF